MNMKSIMINAELPQQTSLTIDQALRQAIAHHQAGQLKDAEHLYCAILQAQPHHPDANHNLGMLAVQVKQPAAGLPHLKAALEASPNQGQYWLSYIDALIQTGQTDAARQVVAQGRQRGLQGEAVETLAGRLDHLENATPEQPAELECAIAHREAGRYKEAALVLQSWLVSNPQDASAHALLAQVLSLDKQDEPAWAALNIALSINPALPIVQRNHARLLLKQQKPDEALQAAQAAYQSDVTDPENQLVLAAALGATNQNEQALLLVASALQSRPNYAEAFASRALLKLRGNDLSGALADAEKSLSIKSHLGQLWGMVSSLRHQFKNLPGAMDALEKALDYEPDNVGHLVNLGEFKRQTGEVGAAIALLEKAVAIAPDKASAWVNLGTVLQESQRIPEAKAAYAKALEIAPQQAEVASNLGALAKEERNWEEALRYFNQALEIKPDFAEAHSNLGITLKNLGRLDEAEASYRRALQIKPDFAEAHFNLGNTLKNMGQLDEAEASYRRALQIKPDFAGAHSNLLFCLSHNTMVDAETLFFEHCRFGEQFEIPFRANRPQHTNSRNPERSLRIGFVSGDLRNHAAAYFIELVLAHLSRYPQLSLHAYSNHTIEDAVTQRIREYFTHWHFIVNLSDAALAEKIRADSIDILIDLSGHTDKNRLLVFARKPAPVQASWIGYPGTTGLQAMDYYLADRFFLPPGQFDDQFTEKIVHLPASAPFLPFKSAPPVNTLPALSNGYVTFGSFNRPSKLGPSVMASWSQLLRALPESRMVLGAMPQDGYGALIDRFAQEGIARERLSFHPKCGMGVYLALHHQVDFCLDSFPYPGGTTSCHALWMGVPTLTMVGSTPVSRVGATLLSHVGLEGFVALDAEDFVKKGLNWAKDVEALVRIRTGLRARFEQSAIGQPALIVEGLQRALRIMWQRWCDGLPPVTLDVSDNQMNRAMHEDDK